MTAQAVASPLVGRVVLPGDQVAVVLPDVAAADGPSSAAARVVRVGAGLRAEEGRASSSSIAITAAKAGVLRAAPRTGQLWVDGVRARRYAPCEGDPVVGSVLDKAGGDHYSVDVGAPQPALLPVLAFEGATRRNRPLLASGDLVYARVVAAPRDADASLACTDAAGQAAGFGPLAGGALARVTPAFARALLRAKPPSPVLIALGKHAGAFEVAVGANGRVWVAAPTLFGAACVARALEAAEAVPPTEAERWVEGRVRAWREAAGVGGGEGEMGAAAGAGAGRIAAAAAAAVAGGDRGGDADEQEEEEMDLGLG
jgi:exosome complex component RRP40